MSEKPAECDFCRFETKKLEFYEFHPNPGIWLCTVCASTDAGNAMHYPEQYENKYIMKQISYCVNLIISEIRKSK